MKMFSLKLITPVVLLAALIFTVACAGSAPAATPSVAATTAPTSAPSIAPTNAPAATRAPTAAPATATPAALTLQDDANRQVTINGVPQRIVSLAPSTTEIAFAVGAGDRVVAVDQFSDYPDAAKSLPKVTQGFNYNYEQIVALKPDLVLAAGITAPDVVKKLEDLKLTVFVVGAPVTTFDNVKNDIQLEGQALGASDQAKQVTAAMDQKIADVKAKVAQAKTTPRVYWELDSTDPTKPYAPGPGSFINDLIQIAGGVSVTANAKEAYAQFSAEEIINANPDIIILSDASYGTTVDSVKARPGWNVIDAVKNNKVYPIDDNLVSRPGPRLADGLEAAAKLIHPEVFQTAAATTYDDPFVYCAAVGTIDAPDALYTGPKVPDSVAKGLQKALGGNVELQPLYQNSFWRCMDGKVYACTVGANLPCESKANTDRTPTQAELDFCKANPSSDFIPMVVTGHDTAFEWACKNGAPEIVKQVVQPDARGFLSNIWYQISPG
jgi:cobalamin transport system substrate-binding protein